MFAGRWEVVLACIFCISRELSFAVQIENNAYRDIFVGISPSVNQKSIDLMKLKSILTKASERLFRATKRRSYFSEFVVTIPHHWDDSTCNGTITTEESFNYYDMSVYIQNSPPVRAQHSEGCGQRGEVILLPVQWMDENQDDDKLALEFVREWAIYRYGVFEEKPLREGSCYSLDEGGTWSPNACYNTKGSEKISLDSNDLPICEIQDDALSSAITSSIMSGFNTDNMTDFCDGSDALPHSPVAETRHNILCDGRPVWNIIENNEDFRYGKNPPVEDVHFLPNISVKCAREQPVGLHFLIQNASTSDITELVNEVRHSLLRFLTYGLLANTNVTITTFSDEMWTGRGISESLDLAKRDDLTTKLKENIRVTTQVSSVCVPCGLRKAAENLETSGSPSTLLVVILLSSALQKLEVPEVLSALEAMKRKVFFLIPEDKSSIALPVDIVNALHEKGGGMFYLPVNETSLSTEMNVVLTRITKTPFHLEDDVIVVHRHTFKDVKTVLKDTFFVDPKLRGELVYTLNCNHADLLDFKKSDCSTSVDMKNTCIMVSPTNESKPSWSFEFKYLGGIQELTCTSLATLRTSAIQKNLVSFRGWLNHYKIRPGENALVIYAELLANFEAVSDAKVEARVSTLNRGIMEEYSLQLRDNGNGDPDVRKGDGIYSRYFSSFTSKGTYSVSIEAHFPVSILAKDGSSIVLTLKRVSSIGSFLVEVDPPQFDVYPPNRIADLTVAAVNHDNYTVTLRWTAPGGDYDNGRAASYEVKQSQNWPCLCNAWSEATLSIMKSTTDTITPRLSGETEEHEFLFSPSPKSLFYVVVKALDGTRQSSQFSNVVQVFVPNKTSETSKTVATEPSTSVSGSSLVPITLETTFQNDNISSKVPLTTTTAVTSDGSSRRSSPLEETSIPTDSSTTEYNPTEITCPDVDHIIMLASSIGGGCLLLIIIANILFCYCYARRRRKPKTLTKRQSMLPPHNLDITYKFSPEEEGDMPRSGNQYTFVSDGNARFATDSRYDRRNRIGNHPNGQSSLPRNPNNVETSFYEGIDMQTQSLGRFPLHQQASDETLTEDTNVYHLGEV